MEEKEIYRGIIVIIAEGILLPKEEKVLSF